MATLLLWPSMAQAQVLAGQVPKSPALLGMAAHSPHEACKVQSELCNCTRVDWCWQAEHPSRLVCSLQASQWVCHKWHSILVSQLRSRMQQYFVRFQPAHADTDKCGEGWTLYSCRTNSHSKPPMRRAPAPPPHLSTGAPAAATAAENGPPAVETGPTAAAGRTGRCTTEAEASVSGRDAAMTASASSAMQEGAANRSKDVGKTDAQGKVVMGPPPAKIRSGSITKHPFLAAKCLGLLHFHLDNAAWHLQQLVQLPN